MTRIERTSLAIKGGFLVFHLACLLAIFTGVSTAAGVTALVLYTVRALGVTAGYHRYFAHRSFRTGRVFQFILAFFGSLSVQGGVLWWVSHHREHHKHTETGKDIHSPTMHGMWRAHMGWMMHEDCLRTSQANIKDFARFPELKWLQRNYAALIAGQALAIFLFGVVLNYLFPSLGTSGLQMLVWGFFISTVLLWHSTFMVNSVCHRWGGRPYEAGDDSTNNLIVGILTMGEGWHNNHHKFAYSARHGLRWYQIDVTWYLLRLLAMLGVVSDLKLPRERDLAAD